MMMSTLQFNNIRTILGVRPPEHLHAIVDGAAQPGLTAALTSQRIPHECLYRGALPGDVRAAAPALVHPDRPEHIDWLIAQCWGQSCIIFIESTADRRSLRKHFRTFLIVEDHHGCRRYFRYYDPRVLAAYLPTLTPAEIVAVFGPVARYYYESLESGAIQCAMPSDTAVTIAAAHPSTEHSTPAFVETCSCYKYALNKLKPSPKPPGGA